MLYVLQLPFDVEVPSSSSIFYLYAARGLPQGGSLHGRFRHAKAISGAGCCSRAAGFPLAQTSVVITSLSKLGNKKFWTSGSCGGWLSSEALLSRVAPSLTSRGAGHTAPWDDAGRMGLMTVRVTPHRTEVQVTPRRVTVQITPHRTEAQVAPQLVLRQTRPSALSTGLRGPPTRRTSWASVQSPTTPLRRSRRGGPTLLIVCCNPCPAT